MFSFFCYILLCMQTIATPLEQKDDLPPSCNSPIYCHGDLLHNVQLAQVFEDGKTFVDMKMRTSETEILQNFEDLQKSTDYHPSRNDLEKFVNANFEKGNELTNCTLNDFTKNPKFVQAIKNDTIRKFARDVINIWPTLGRRVKQDVIDNENRYSFIPVPNGFIIPGMRFQEYYYWDSYWVVDALLLNEMYETARGMIENFLYLVDKFGFIPNGGRVYYLRRSQPPLLTPMAYLYYETTKDMKWVSRYIATLAKELTYWEDQSVDVIKSDTHYRLYHYSAKSYGPRPESYREDFLTVSSFKGDNTQREVYIDIKSGAESGWDFSNRWVFDDKGGNYGNRSNTQTRRIIPVDLNSFLCMGFKHIAYLYSQLGKPKEASFWNNKYLSIRDAIENVLWYPSDGIWYDYDLKFRKHRRYFYPANVAPLWAKCVYYSKSQTLGYDVLAYLERVKALEYSGGVPTSLKNTGEQWDFPNAWSVMQDLIVRGLQNSNYKKAQQKAEDLAKRWVAANLLGFINTGKMFEKYDVLNPGHAGGGGEYEVQPGFGFTNAVILRFIHDYYTKSKS